MARVRPHPVRINATLTPTAAMEVVKAVQLAVAWSTAHPNQACVRESLIQIVVGASLTVRTGWCVRAWIRSLKNPARAWSPPDAAVAGRISSVARAGVVKG